MVPTYKWARRILSFFALVGLGGGDVVMAQTPLYWGGGSANIANGTALPLTSNGLCGVWNTTTLNWASDYNGTTYSAYADGATAMLGYFNHDNASTIARVFIDAKADLQMAGMIGSIISARGFNHRFVLSNNVPTTLTLAGSDFIVNIAAANVNVGMEWRTNILLSGSVPLTKKGESLLLVNSASPNFTGPVEVHGGTVNLRDGGAWPGVSSVYLRGFHTRSADETGGNSYSWPYLQMIAPTTGVVNQLHNDAVITMSRGQLVYQSRGNNIENRASVQTIRKLVLEPQGSIDIQTVASGGTYTGKLILADSTAGIDRGTSGRGTLLLIGTNMVTQIIVQNGVALGGVVPWIVNSRGQFIRLNALTKHMEVVPSTAAPTDLSTWVAASDYLAGNNTAFTPSSSIGNISINSLGLYSTVDTTLTIGNGNTLTIASGGISHQPAGSGGAKATVIKGGSLTSGSDELYIHGGDSSFSHSLVIDAPIVGSGLDVIKAGVGGLTFSGNDANTYSGTTYINMGVLTLRKTNAVAIAGDLVIQSGGSVVLQGVGEQFSATSKVTIEDGGVLGVLNNSPTHNALLTINGGTYRIGNRFPIVSVAGTGIAFNGGRIEYSSTASGSFSLQTDVSYASGSTRPALWNRFSNNTSSDPGAFAVELDGGNRTFNIANSSTLPPSQAEMVFLTSITNGSPADGSITKTGAGTLQFTTTNFYTGGTTINQGILHVARYKADSFSGLRASINNSGQHGSVITLHAPVATNFLIGQSISGTGISSRRTVLEIMDPFMIQASGGGGALTDSVNVAIGAIDRTGTLGTGSVTNNGGTLLIDAGVSLPNTLVINGGTVTNNGTWTGSITVNGGVLTGTGTNSGGATLVGGTVLMKLGGGATVNGTISPAGSATGTLQVVGNVTWNSGASWSAANDWLFDLAGDGASDLLDITGDFIKGAGSAYRFDFRGFAETGTFTLVTWTGNLTGFSSSDFSFVNVGEGNSAVFSVVGKTLKVTISECATAPDVTLGSGPNQCSPATPTAATISHSTGGSTPTKYSIDFSDAANTAGFSDSLNQTYTVSPLPFTIPANVAGGIYTARVIMVDASGCSGYDEFTVTITAAPATPGSISQSGGGTTACAGSLGITYSISPIAGATAYTWTVPEKATITSGQGTTQIAVNWAADTGAGDLQVSVIASNTCGASATRSSTFTIRTGAPGAPTSAEATDISITSFTANWTAPTFVNGQQVEGYLLDVATASDFSTGFVASNLVRTSAQTSYVLSGLSGGQTYYYRVRAYNACGNGAYSATQSVLTPLVLAGWDVSALTGGSGSYGTDGLTPTTQHGGVAVTGFTRGSGVGTAGVGTPRGWGGTGWNSSTADAAISANKFATIDITPAHGNFVSFYSINLFDYRRSGNGATSGKLQYSTNGTTFADIADISYPASTAEGATLGSLPISLSGINALQNVPQTITVTFRIVNFGASSADGDWYVYDKAISAEHDFEIRGTVCSNPPAFTVTGGGTTCSSGSGVAVGLSGSTAGVTYELYRDDVATGIIRAGTGSSISFGPQAEAGEYTVKATRNSGGCTADMSGQVEVTVTQTPGIPADLVAVTNDNQTVLTWSAPDGFTVTGYNVKRSTASDGTYSTVLGGTNVATTNFTVTSGVAGITYYYKITALNAGCESDPSDDASANWPGDCPTGEAPSIGNPGNKTVNVGSTLSHSITAQEASPLCPAPLITNSPLPGWMTHSVINAGNSATLQLGGLPTDGSQGAYPITVTARDGENLSTSRTFIVYVGNFGESGNGGSAPPGSLANWSVTIHDLEHVSGNDFRVVWEAKPQVAYDIYTATTFPGGSWSALVRDLVTAGISNQYTVPHSGERTYIQVVPAGTSRGTNGVWAVVQPTIPASISFMSIPLAGTDRDFGGEFGDTMAATLPTAGTTIYIMDPGTGGPDVNGDPIDWIILERTVSGWTKFGGGALPVLEPGQGFIIFNEGGSASPTFSGPVGNTGANSITLAGGSPSNPGYNIIGISEGKAMPASAAFDGISVVGSYDENQADQLIIMDPFRRLIRRPDGTWYDTGNPNSPNDTTLQLMPGQAYYFIRRGTGAELDF